ncbi:carboxymuconolactone decarboxylase family protein [Paeniglutamicibacter antarcticus]|uniref:Carboxymuconolactone decarboxylase family protein n=1 Tax=Arthrobacter terrae TaxID=2935737 RepID=A0A931CLU5_9MICC|nr:carboxymuconolactone decarboxylase family protein [Arthrobacter terrae]MBG0737839.1 carboxymuconolactone decarboxylase family protein [Arthrobacter terrae]
MSHQQRLDIWQVDPAALQAVLGMEKSAHRGSLENSLLELVKIRASQLNGCAWCLDMHNRDAAAEGESPRRLYVLAGWREAPELYTPREQAALTMTEAVTHVSQEGVPDHVWNQAKDCFDEKELAQLLMAIATINVWNRMAVATRQALPDEPPTAD